MAKLKLSIKKSPQGGGDGDSVSLPKKIIIKSLNNKVAKRTVAVAGNRIVEPTKTTLGSMIKPVVVVDNTSARPKAIKAREQPQRNEKRYARGKDSMLVHPAMQWLVKKYPKCFSTDRKKVFPIAIGTLKEIDMEDSGFSKAEFRKAFRHYCSRKEYLNNFSRIKYRIDLNGNDAQIITDMDKKCARNSVENISTKKEISTIEQSTEHIE